MGTRIIKELLLYRYRYIFGYLALIVLSVGLTMWQLDSIPPGFSQAEQQSAVASNALHVESSSFVNLPYHLLQKGTIELFNIDVFGVRLPSVICALLIAAAAYFLLRRWYGESIAVIGAVLVVTSAHFLVRGRLGSPLILYSLWPALLLLTATLANFQGKGWRFWIWLFAIIAGLALYTPYLGFLLIIIALAAMASRQGRGLISEIGSPVAMLSVVTFLALLIPMGYTIYKNPAAAWAFVGSIDAPNLSFVIERLKEMLHTLADFQIDGSQLFSPTLSIPAIAFGVYGLYYSLKNLARPRYAVIALWLFTSIAIFLSIQAASIAILFVPMSLVIIVGLWRFIRYWYGIFPRNPYARLVALVPIALLLFVMVEFNYNRYFYGVARSENVHSLYDSDTLKLQKQLAENSALQNASVIVPQHKQAFYELLTKKYTNLTIGTSSNDIEVGAPLIVARDSLSGVTAPEGTSKSLVVDGRAGDDAVRFYVFE